MGDVVSCIGGGIVIVICTLFMDLFFYTYARHSILGIDWDSFNKK
jgi:hypothetical protein